MEFKARTSSKFIMNMFLIVIAFGMTLFCFFYTEFKYEIFKYCWIVWFLIGFARLLVYRKFIGLVFNRNLILAVNEHYIEDIAAGIKYYWKDIDEVYEDNLRLYIKLFDQALYIDKMGNFTMRLFSGFTFRSILTTHNTPFVINIDLVDVSTNALLQILDDYSIEAARIENISAD